MSSSKINVIEHQGMHLTFNDGGLCTFNTGNNFSQKVESPPRPTFQLAMAGYAYGNLQSMVSGHTSLPGQMALESLERDSNRIQERRKHEATGLVVESVMEFVANAAVMRMTATATNTGDEPVTLTHLSSMYLPGIATDGLLAWHDPRKMKVHYCRQAWNGEGQWRSADFDELAIHPTSSHGIPTAFHVASIGSFSTSRFLPMCLVEDVETGKVWYFQIEASANWHYEIGYTGSVDEASGSLFIHADAANERHGGWAHTLQPGESFTTAPVGVGCCNGGFTEAVRELTKYRRSVLKPAPAWEGECPVAFNDYMNCLWADPTIERLQPLVEAVGKTGADIFCIDAGWFGPRGSSWGEQLGVWEPSEDRFGPDGLKGMLNIIKANGMIPGIWLEVEVADETSTTAQKPDEWFLHRYGKRVGGGARQFLNFANPAVREHMHGVIDRLVAMGVGFFKNDYNDCVCMGDDTLGTTAADGLLAHSRAFYSFIDEVRERHPKVIFENCGSGAMREDYGILAHFHLQSSSDQEDYRKYPSIVTGSLAGILPEQLGIWAYPYPTYFWDKGDDDVLKTPEYVAQRVDGEETIFNMVNGMCGNLYLSGRIEYMDEPNMALVQEGVELFKKERAHIHNGYPIWPLGMNRLNDDASWAAVGIENEDRTRVLLAVWRRDSAQAMQTLEMPGWAGCEATVRQIYPAKDFDVPFSFNAQAGTLTVELAKTNQARHFELVR